MRGSSRLAGWLVTGTALLASACGTDAAQPPGPGNAARGREEIRKHGCGACHVIPGIPGARGSVGPPLADYGRRAYIAGRLPNTAESVSAFLQDPLAFAPDSAMPDLGLDPSTADDMAAWLLRVP